MNTVRDDDDAHYFDAVVVLLVFGDVREIDSSHPKEAEAEQMMHSLHFFHSDVEINHLKVQSKKQDKDVRETRMMARLTRDEKERMSGSCDLQSGEREREQIPEDGFPSVSYEEMQLLLHSLLPTKTASKTWHQMHGEEEEEVDYIHTRNWGPRKMGEELMEEEVDEKCYDDDDVQRNDQRKAEESQDLKDKTTFHIKEKGQLKRSVCQMFQQQQQQPSYDGP